MDNLNWFYILKLNYSIFISKFIELPLCIVPSEFLRYRLLNPMMRGTQGTIDATCIALEKGWAINLSGGYHHACTEYGGGFCIYPDITLAIRNLRKYHNEKVKRIMIVDLVRNFFKSSKPKIIYIFILRMHIKVMAMKEIF